MIDKKFIEVTIEVADTDLLDLGVKVESETVKCLVQISNISMFYVSFDDDKDVYGTKIHTIDGGNIWCFEKYEQIKEMLK